MEGHECSDRPAEVAAATVHCLHGRLGGDGGRGWWIILGRRGAGEAKPGQQEAADEGEQGQAVGLQLEFGEERWVAIERDRGATAGGDTSSRGDRTACATLYV